MSRACMHAPLTSHEAGGGDASVLLALQEAKVRIMHLHAAKQMHEKARAALRAAQRARGCACWRATQAG